MLHCQISLRSEYNARLGINLKMHLLQNVMFGALHENDTIYNIFGTIYILYNN